MDEIQTLRNEIDRLTIQANEDMITILRLRSELTEERLVTDRLLTKIVPDKGPLGQQTPCCH